MNKKFILLFKIFVSIFCFLNAKELKTNNPKSLMEKNDEGDKELFFENPSVDLYWNALLQIAKRNKTKALEIVEAIKNGTSLEISSNWKKPFPKNIDDFFDRLFLSYIYKSPQFLTYLGLFESIGIYNHNAFLNDYSIKAFKRNLEERKKNLQILKMYDFSTLSKDQKISYKVIKHNLESEIEGENFIFHDYRINHMFGTLFFLNRTFTVFHKLDNEENIDNYILRLKKIPIQIEQIIDFLKCQREKNILLPKFAVEKMVNALKGYTEVPISENIFYAHFKKSIEKVKRLDKSSKLKIAKEVIGKEVFPAYEKLLKYFVKLLEVIENDYGVWALPNGDEYYKHRLKCCTTTDLTADQIHELGLKEVDKILKKMRVILAKNGIEDPKKLVSELAKEFFKNSKAYYSNTEEGRKKCLADFNSILERSRKELFPLFEIKPKAPLKIMPVPKEEEKNAFFAYYRFPSIDGTREGVFYVNLSDMKEFNKYEMEALLLHEGEPGHHFQCSVQNELDLPILRRVDWNSAYGEGWALYVENLGYDHGFYSSPFYELGYFNLELLRAIRLVVDTGIHSKKWSKEKAVEYMEKIGGFPRKFAEREVERYFIWPGQACSYKIGQLKILELKERAKEKLKKKFDIREFHSVILKMGSVPLEVLEEEIDEYIKNKL
jgi:uncharacterized protein (DUF885 family)